MIDEASRKMALPIALKGRAARLARTTHFTPEGAVKPHVAGAGS